MAMTSQPTSPASERPRYLEQRAPILFPESAEVPETQLHLNLRTLLYLLLQDALGDGVTVCSDQFVYFDAEDPSRCLAPDAFVRRVAPTELVRTWKVWERGAPEVAVEIVSDADAGELPWDRKLSHYRHLGVTELLRFDPADNKRPLRIWDRVQGALVERELSGQSERSLVLPIEWVVAAADNLPRALRVRLDGTLVPTAREALEQERLAKEKERLAKEEEQLAREAAEARVQELEAQLRQRRG
jgi:Uma2 family endonuclease